MKRWKFIVFFFLPCLYIIPWSFKWFRVSINNSVAKRLEYADVYASPEWDRYNITQKNDFILNNFMEWRSYDKSVITSQFDPVSCRNPLWRPQSAWQSSHGKNLTRTFVLGVTSMQRPYIRNAIQSVRMLRKVSDIDISIIVLDSVSVTALTDLGHQASKYANVHIHAIPNPVDVRYLAPSLVDDLRDNPNCCGVGEFIRLHTFALPYDKAMFLDLDVHILKPIDHLFDCDVDFMYAGGVGSPLNAGIFVASANRPSLLTHMVHTLYAKSYTYTQELGYDDLGCGPCNCGACRMSDASSPRCHGQEGPQGFLHYYFVKRPAMAYHFPLFPTTQRAHEGEAIHRPDTALSTDRDTGTSIALSFSQSSVDAMIPFKVARMSSCTYDYQNFPIELCEPEWAHKGGSGTAVAPYIVHKGGIWAKKLIAEPPPSYYTIGQRRYMKPCAPEFWIVGARKSGTTALYTWMTEHPQIARLHIQNKPTDGEVGEALNRQNLGRYNAHFRGVSVGMIKGDSKVSRIINDAKTMVESCGHKEVRFIVLLRDPVERAVSNMLMRARLHTAGMNMESNISHFMESDLLAFEEAERQFPRWNQDILPKHLNNWQSSSNCIYEGLYAIHLRRWFMYAGVDNIRIYFTEEFGQYPEAVVTDALAFVGADMTAWEAGRATRRFSKINAPNSRQSSHRSATGTNWTNDGSQLPANLLLTAALRKRLEGIFAPYNRMLERLLNSSSPWGY